MPTDPAVTAAVEGAVDEAVVRRLVAHVGAVSGDVYGKNGKPHLRQRINGYNNAARRERRARAMSQSATPGRYSQRRISRARAMSGAKARSTAAGYRLKPNAGSKAAAASWAERSA